MLLEEPSLQGLTPEQPMATASRVVVPEVAVSLWGNWEGPEMQLVFGKAWEPHLPSLLTSLSHYPPL